MQVLKIKSNGKFYRFDFDLLKREHAKELDVLNERSAGYLTEVLFKDRDYLLKWLKGRRRRVLAEQAELACFE